MNKTIKWILWLAAIGVLVLLGWRFMSVKKADAYTIQQHDKIWICHVPKEGKSVSLYVDEHGWDGHDHHKNDYKGKCKVEPTPTLTPTPTEEPTPTPEPEVTPEPVVTVVSHDGPVAASAEPTCKDLGGYAPTITKVGRLDIDTVFVEYTSPSPNADKFLIWYGLSADNLQWNTITKELWVELNGEELVGKHVWLNVRAMSEGCTGVPSVTTDP